MADKCGFWKGHNFAKWEEVSQGIIRHCGREVGIVIVQKRQCADCGYVEINTQKTTILD